VFLVSGSTYVTQQKQFHPFALYVIKVQLQLCNAYVLLKYGKFKEANTSNITKYQLRLAINTTDFKVYQTTCTFCGAIKLSWQSQSNPNPNPN
jgi:hypothetical protein